MKNYLLFGLLLGALATSPTLAQDQQQQQQQDDTRRQQMQDRLAEYAQRLKLTDDQKQQMTDVLKDEAQKMRDARDKYQSSGDRRGMMQDMRAIQDDLNNRVAQFLSKDQMKEWNKIQDETRERRRDMMRRRRSQRDQ